MEGRILTKRFRSLRVRLLLPLLSVAILSAVAVAIFSYWLGDRWARQQIAARYQGIAQTLSGASFPLNRQVVQLLADLTDTDLITLASDGTIIESSIEVAAHRSFADLADATKPPNEANDLVQNLMTITDRSYRFAVFPRSGIALSNDRADRVAVLFSEDELRGARFRAAMLPLATGLSTIFLLASVTLGLAGRLVRRLARLQQQVDRIAEGNFDTQIPIGSGDEIGLLGTAVKHMSSQLQQVWSTLHRQQGEKLLHQIAGGLAHQLRNGITGARMAVELHDRHCPSRDDGSLAVALNQLEQTEYYVRRLLLVAAGEQQQDRPGPVRECIGDIRSNLAATAKHLNIDLKWQVSKDLHRQQVCDTSSLAAALTNLVLNAMQAGTEVEVNVSIDQPNLLRVDVMDNGPGPPTDIADQVFEPFVTSKPEGLGLGLPLVKRSAERLGGRVEWNRGQGKTRFVLLVSTF